MAEFVTAPPRSEWGDCKRSKLGICSKWSWRSVRREWRWRSVRSKWGQIPIQDSDIPEARGDERNWALTPLANRREKISHRHSAFTPVLILVLALLLAQTLGFMHRIVHHPVGRTQLSTILPVPSVARASQSLTAGKSMATGPLAALFQHNDDDPSCRLYDQASNFDTLAGLPPLALPMVLASHTLLDFEGEFLARWVALFDARGPPSIR